MGVCFSSGSGPHYSGKSSTFPHPFYIHQFKFSHDGFGSVSGSASDDSKNVAPKRVSFLRLEVEAWTTKYLFIIFFVVFVFVPFLFLFLHLMARFWNGQTWRCSISRSWNLPQTISGLTQWSVKVVLSEFRRDGWMRTPSLLPKQVLEWSLP